MKNFRIFSIITTAATYFLIFMGGLVRVSGAGLGCPDWPHCFGRWIPPTSVSQLPVDIDPAQFNFVLAWIEYFNRLCGVLVGFLILITALWAIIKYRNFLKIVIPAALAAILTAFQGWQGSVVVASELEPVIVSVHMVLALIIVSLLVFMTHETYYTDEKQVYTKLTIPRKATFWAGMLWLIGIVQILLGTQIRSALEVIRIEFPLLSGAEWVSKVGLINHLHMTLGVLLVAFSWYVASMLLKYKEQIPAVMRQSVVALVLIATAQLFLGLSFILVDVTPLLQLFHLLMASLFIGLALLVYAITSKRTAEI